MTTIEYIAAIRLLVTELIGRISDRNVAQLAQQIQRYQHELEGEITRDRAAYEKEKEEMRSAHAKEVAALQEEITRLSRRTITSVKLERH